jgi:hypothetical protein
MTATLQAGPEATCSQVFTERYDKFIFGNDTVTAFDPDWDAHKALTAKPGSPDR